MDLLNNNASDKPKQISLELDLELINESSTRSSSPQDQHEYSFNENMKNDIEEFGVTEKLDKETEYFSTYQNNGSKKYMQDKIQCFYHSQTNIHFFGLYDGFGSSLISNHLKENLHNELFRNINTC